MFYIIRKVLLSELKFEKILHLWSFFVKLWGLKIAILASLGQLTRDIFRALNA